MRGRWKDAHVATCFGDDHVSDERRDARNRAQRFPGNSKGLHDRVDLLRQQIAQGWAIQGKRTYKNVTGVPGLGGDAAVAALERLCDLGWAERGLEIKCTACHQHSFVVLDSVFAKSGARCPACDDPQRYTLTGSGPTVFYRLDGLVDRASDQGVFPHLLTVAALTQLEAHSWFLPGVDVVFHDEARNEADVVGLHGGRFIVREVKTSASEFTGQQLDKDIRVAKKAGSRCLSHGCTRSHTERDAGARARPLHGGRA